MEDAETRPVNYGFTGTRQQALKTIYELGARQCLYSREDKWANFCDCKYGSAHIGGGMGEQTGCPELRTLHLVVSYMSDDEWEETCARPLQPVGPTRGEPCEAPSAPKPQIIVQGTGWPEDRHQGLSDPMG